MVTDAVQLMVDEIEQVGGVLYVWVGANDCRVVFKHRATSMAVREVEEITGCSGEMAATQEHKVSIEYPKAEFTQ